MRISDWSSDVCSSDLTGLSLASCSNCCVAAISASCPCEPRSCKRKSKPDALPKEEMGGGMTENTMESGKPNSSDWVALAEIACAESSSPLRSEKSLSGTHAIAEFRPLPLQLKP